MIRVTEDFSVRNLSGVPKLTPNPLFFHTGTISVLSLVFSIWKPIKYQDFLVVWPTGMNSAGLLTSSHGDHEDNYLSGGPLVRYSRILRNRDSIIFFWY